MGYLTPIYTTREPLMLTKNEAIILRVTLKYDGEFSWYPMDSFAWRSGWKPEEVDHVYDQTNLMIEKGYIRAEKKEGLKDLVYWITDLGRAELKKYNEIQEKAKNQNEHGN